MYTATLSRAVVPPIVVSGTFVEGNITIARGTGNTSNTDFWIYDSGFLSIPAYGHDDPNPSGLTRPYTPGTYYVAISDFNRFWLMLRSPITDRAMLALETHRSAFRASRERRGIVRQHRNAPGVRAARGPGDGMAAQQRVRLAQHVVVSHARLRSRCRSHGYRIRASCRTHSGRARAPCPPRPRRRSRAASRTTRRRAATRRRG